MGLMGNWRIGVIEYKRISIDSYDKEDFNGHSSHNIIGGFGVGMY